MWIRSGGSFVLFSGEASSSLKGRTRAAGHRLKHGARASLSRLFLFYFFFPPKLIKQYIAVKKCIVFGKHEQCKILVSFRTMSAHKTQLLNYFNSNTETHWTKRWQEKPSICIFACKEISHAAKSSYYKSFLMLWFSIPSALKWKSIKECVWMPTEFRVKAQVPLRISIIRLYRRSKFWLQNIDE